LIFAHAVPEAFDLLLPVFNKVIYRMNIFYQQPAPHAYVVNIGDS